MIDRLLRFVSLLLICSNVRFSVEAFQHIEKITAATRLNVDAVSIQPFTINALFQPRYRIRLCFLHSNKSENEPEIIYVDETSNNGVVIPDDVIEEMNAGQPSDLIIMKDLLGINIFTYILAAAIAFFFSMNILLGPGWLGNSFGLEGTGTFEKVSDSLPNTIDLSKDDYLI